MHFSNGACTVTLIVPADVGSESGYGLQVTSSATAVQLVCFIHTRCAIGNWATTFANV